MKFTASLLVAASGYIMVTLAGGTRAKDKKSGLESKAIIDSVTALAPTGNAAAPVDRLKARFDIAELVPKEKKDGATITGDANGEAVNVVTNVGIEGPVESKAIRVAQRQVTSDKFCCDFGCTQCSSTRCAGPGACDAPHNACCVLTISSEHEDGAIEATNGRGETVRFEDPNSSPEQADLVEKQNNEAVKRQVVGEQLCCDVGCTQCTTTHCSNPGACDAPHHVCCPGVFSWQNEDGTMAGLNGKGKVVNFLGTSD